MRAYAARIDEQVKVDPSEPAVVASRFLEAFSAADFERMRALLAEDVVAYVTNAEGGVDKVEGMRRSAAGGSAGPRRTRDRRNAPFHKRSTHPAGVSGLATPGPRPQREPSGEPQATPAFRATAEVWVCR